MIAEQVMGRIENAVREVNKELSGNNSSSQWENLSEEELFLELSSCIIGSRITYEKAKTVSDLIKDDDLLSLQELITNPKKYESRIYSILRQEKCLYAKSKARYIVSTGIRIYMEEGTSIKKILKKSQDQYTAREILADLCLGIGLKQASLFLRNIYYADNLAILDTHVINFIHLMGLEAGSDKSLSKRLYLTYENQLRSYSEKFNTSIAKLDVSIWVVMRTISREFKWML